MSQNAPFKLRRATAEDAYALWLWRNDVEARRASFEQRPIDWAEHVAWLGARLRDPAAVVLVAALSDGRPLGSVRFDTEDDWNTARLSFVVAAEARGQGLGRPLVVEGVKFLRRSHARVAVHADVHTVNDRSLRVFRSAGWSEGNVGDGVVRFWCRDGAPPA